MCGVWVSGVFGCQGFRWCWESKGSWRSIGVRSTDLLPRLLLFHFPICCFLFQRGGQHVHPAGDGPQTALRYSGSHQLQLWRQVHLHHIWRVQFLLSLHTTGKTGPEWMLHRLVVLSPDTTMCSLYSSMIRFSQ